MAIIKAKPTSPARRHVVQIKTPGLWKGGPERSLTAEKRKTGGRDNYGHISTRKEIWKESEYKEILKQGYFLA